MSQPNEMPAPKTSSDETSNTRNSPSSSVERRVAEIGLLLRNLDQTAAESRSSSNGSAVIHENRLVQVKLGVASGLFTALRSKHAPTASHCLRVALQCSAWSLASQLPAKLRDEIEVAALLHDIGKIGVPDAVLHKPGNLTSDEAAVMSRHVRTAIQVLSTCCASNEVVENVRYNFAWYDGSDPTFDLQGKSLPLGARMIAIADAFDAMTTDHVYRPARPRERALAELFEFAGTQFDPDLVTEFVELHSENRLPLDQACRHWLGTLASDWTASMWRHNAGTAQADQMVHEDRLLFDRRLIETMHDGVVFVDSQCRIFYWNSGTERLTGIDATAAESQIWKPSLLDLRNKNGKSIPDDGCPVMFSIRAGTHALQKRFSIIGRSGRVVAVDLQVVPVLDANGTTRGATILLRDVSSETTLEERCQDLQNMATKDPLTQIANRAEFDRVHPAFIEEHLESKLPCSLIICDIDRFKHINDTYGHQAGDQAIVSCVQVLKNTCRSGDLVARYGGEEFVVLCTNCNNAAAARRAEQMRLALADMPQPSLGGRRITASFGVTELQLGDSAETMLRRADRALLQAKDGGRNQVVQLGTGMCIEPKRRVWWPFHPAKPTPGVLLEARLATEVPFKMAVQKIRGFVADHRAEISEVGHDRMSCVVQKSADGAGQRQNGRLVPLLLELTFSEKRHRDDSNRARDGHVVTHIEVVIRPRRQRDHRHQQVADQARQTLASLKSYLMARDLLTRSQDNVLSKARRAIAPWRKKD